MTKWNRLVRQRCAKRIQTYAFHNTSAHPASEDVSKSTDLKKVLAAKIPAKMEEIKTFRKEHGKFVMGQVTINQMYGGMRGIPGLVCETSLLDANDGITYRGRSIPDLQQCLPAAKGFCEPLPEGIFWLLVTGDIPTDAQVAALSKEFAERSCLPEHIHVLLDNLPKNVHPMAQLSTAITALSSESLFFRAYHCGVRKTEYWESTYEDSMNLIAKLPVIAAKIYKNTYKGGSKDLHVDTNMDWAHNFAHMLGYQKPDFVELLRLYLTVHSDHEGGNVSAHTTHLVGSALSDPYLSLGAGMNGLAGPLHGLANQESLIWLESLRKAVGDNYDEKAVKDFVEATLKSGQVIPGYGHAVLRKTDPRYMAQREFALKHLPDDPMFKLVATVFKVVPPVLQGLKKVANPWPNVDAHSGILLQHYGLVEANYYTVLFGVSRSLGVLSSLIWDRALLYPIERPKSYTTDYLIKFVKEGGKK